MHGPCPATGSRGCGVLSHMMQGHTETQLMVSEPVVPPWLGHLQAEMRAGPSRSLIICFLLRWKEGTTEAISELLWN